MKSHILVAEDDKELQTIVVEELTEAGFAVDAADDGAIAIEYLKSKAYDILLLDNRMPRKSGIEVLEYIRSEHVDVRTIMVTGVRDQVLANQAMKLGAIQIITKPFGITDLIRCIRKVLAP